MKMGSQSGVVVRKRVKAPLLFFSFKNLEHHPFTQSGCLPAIQPGSCVYCVHMDTNNAPRVTGLHSPLDAHVAKSRPPYATFNECKFKDRESWEGWKSAPRRAFVLFQTCLRQRSESFARVFGRLETIVSGFRFGAYDESTIRSQPMPRWKTIGSENGIMKTS